MNTEIATLILFIINGVQYYYIICAFFERTINKFFVGAFIYTAICLALRMIASLFEGGAYEVASVVVIAMQIVILYPLFRFKKWYYACIIEFVVMMTMIFLQVPTIWLAELITGTNVIEETNGADFNLSYVIATALNCMIYMIFIVVVYIIRFFIRYKTSKLLLLSSFLVAVYQLLVITLFYALCWENGESAVYGGVLFVFFSIITDMGILISIENLFKKMQIEKEWSQFSSQRRKEYEYYYGVQLDIEKMRMERHDCINYIQTIERMIQEPEHYSDAQKMIRELQQICRSNEA